MITDIYTFDFYIPLNNYTSINTEELSKLPKCSKHNTIVDEGTAYSMLNEETLEPEYNLYIYNDYVNLTIKFEGVNKINSSTIYKRSIELINNILDFKDKTVKNIIRHRLTWFIDNITIMTDVNYSVGNPESLIEDYCFIKWKVDKNCYILNLNTGNFKVNDFTIDKPNFKVNDKKEDFIDASKFFDSLDAQIMGDFKLKQL